MVELWECVSIHSRRPGKENPALPGGIFEGSYPPGFSPECGVRVAQTGTPIGLLLAKRLFFESVRVQSGDVSDNTDLFPICSEAQLLALQRVGWLNPERLRLKQTSWPYWCS